MSRTLLVVLLVLAAAYLLLIVGLLAAGRRTDARAWAGFVPDCLILFKRLLGDPRVPRRRKALLVFAMTYLAMPIDLVPDFIPVAGQLDDAIVVAAVLRTVVRTTGSDLIGEHWSGPHSSLRVLLRLAGVGLDQRRP